MGYRFTNPEYELVSTVFCSAKAEYLSVIHITDEFTVLAFVGELRIKEHKALKGIMDILNKPGKSLASERHVQKLYERYTVLIQASVEDHSKKSFMKRLKLRVELFFPLLV